MESRKASTSISCLNAETHTQQRAFGGGRGIRTPEGLAALAVFKTAPINHSGIPPCAGNSVPCRWPGSSARPQPLQLGRVVLEVADEQLLDELMDGHHAPGGVETLRLPGAAGDVAEKGSEVVEVLLLSMP